MSSLFDRKKIIPLVQDHRIRNGRIGSAHRGQGFLYRHREA